MRRSLYIFLLFVLPLHAQKSSGYHFEHIGTDERFPHFLISSPVQDHFGFIWFVCGNNLIKYDGYKIQTFTSRKSNKDIILQNGRLHPMNDGSVWNVSSDMGYRYDPALESLEKVTFNDIFESGDNITSSYSDSASIWIGTRKGLVYRFDPVSRINTKIISFEKKGTYSSIGRMTKSLSGGIWVSTARKTYKIVNSCIADSISLSSICLCEDHSGNVYLFTYQGLVMRSKGSKKITSRGLEQLFGIMINAITEIRPNEIWIGTATHGIFIYRSNDNIMINLQHDEEDPHSLSSNLVYDIYKDRSDVVWIGTSMYLNKLDLHRKPFNDIARNWKDLKEQNKSFSAVLEDKAGLVWMITTDGKITIMEKSTGRFIKVTNQPLYSPRGLAFSQLCMDSLGFIWAMSWQMGVMKIYPPKQPLGSTTYLIGKHFSKYKDTTELAGWSYRTLFVNSKNELYLGAYDAGGIEKYNRINGRFNLIRIPGIRLWAMAAYPQDRLLLGTADDGLWVYYLKSQSNRYFKHSCKDNNSLTNDNIRCLLVSQDASVWVGTLDGLNRIDMKRNIITRFYTKDGLPNNSIVALQEDDKHNIWIATDNGLSKYDYNTGTFRNYFRSDGLQADQYSYHATCKNKDGYLYFGGVNGISYFHPDSIVDNTIKPSVVISEIRIKSKPLHPGDSINGRVILDRSILLTNTIRLTYKENDVSFQFTGMHYANPGKNRFEYKLENFDKEWKETDAESRLAVYTNLPAGSYILKVKACNNDGIWGDTDAELRVIITPPFWDTWWFKIIVVLLIIILVSYYFMNRAIQAERQQKALAHLVDEQTAELKAQAEKLQEYNTELVNTNEELELLTQELRTQSEELFVTNESLMKLNATRDKLFSIIAHDLRNPFQAILSITEMLQKNFRQYNDTEKFTFVQSLVSSSRSAYNLLDDLLEWSRSQSENVPFEPQHFALHDIILPTLKVLGLQAEAKKITITNTVKPFIKAYADKNMALTVFRNILSNAIKFTPEFGCISISATENEPHAEIMITDNGVGMSDETIHQLFRIDKKQLQTGTTGETGSGLGLIICKDFVEKNHGQLLVNSTQGKGSTFTICLPLTSNYFASTARMKDEAAIKLKEENKDQPADSAESTTDTKKYLILLIEDNANIRLSINAAMTDQYLMQEAENGKSGLEKAFDLIPDIIISDVVMPEMDGLELCRSLKNDQRTCHIPIILLTAKSTDTNKIIGLEMGADDYITKPFNMQVLETRVRNLIRNRELLRNRYCMEYNLSPQSVSANATDQKFIDHILELMDKHLSDEKYDVDTFARDLGMSRRQLYRKFAALYGLSVNEFMKDYRLKQAAKMLVEKKLSISEIAFATGFTSLSYFSNLFHKKFGMTPSGFIENNKA